MKWNWLKGKALPYTVWKVSKYGVFSGPYFPILGPEKIPYLGVSLRVQSEYGKIQTRKNFGHFSCSVTYNS